MKNFFGSYSGKVILFSLLVIGGSIFNIKPWKNAEQTNNLISSDITSYYSYLPALFIQNDISLKFIETEYKIQQLNPEQYQKVVGTANYILNNPESKWYRLIQEKALHQSKSIYEQALEDAYYTVFGDEHSRYFWPTTAPNGGKVIKTTMGLSILYSPFFLMGHIYALISDTYNANGFSKPYEFFLTLSSFFYLLIGLIFLRKMLLRLFNETITSITIFCIVLGTNLYYYATLEPCMSHIYNFSLIAIFIYFVLKWHDKQTLKYTLILGLIGGLIILIRPVNILIFIFFILYNITEYYKKKEIFLANWYYLLLMGIMVLIVFFPQLIYWKHITGNWLFNSYVGEQFYFNKPHLLEFLFSYRSGWLLYSPLMLLSIIGLIIQYKTQKKHFLALIIFSIVNIYILCCWWCWWYGGSFGMRTMIDSYPLLAIPLATTLLWISKQKKMFISIACILIIGLLCLNIFQTTQKRHQVIHWDSMTKQAYWNNFTKLYLESDDEWEKFQTQITAPNYEKAKNGIDEYDFTPF